MDKNQVYCRYCGKLIDEDASFCTYCGKQQKANDDKKNKFDEDSTKAFGSNIKKALRAAVNTCKKIYPGHKTIKKVVISAIAIFGTFLVVLFADWIYSVYVTSQLEEQDREQERIAMTDISKAADIAKDFFKKCCEGEHVDYQGLFHWQDCNFDHREVALKIIRNAAEKGNADAQFTLGAIYAGAHYDAKEPYWDSYTILEEKFAKRAAYWYTLAAKKGHVMALYKLGQAYKEGVGVKQDLVKATELIRKAAEQGEPRAQLSYGDMFRDGEACFRVVTDSIQGEAYIIYAKPNIQWAKEWWKKAAESNDEDIRMQAEERLENIYDSPIEQ